MKVVLALASMLMLLASFASSSLSVQAQVLDLPYSEPYMLVNDSIVGMPIGAGNTFFLLSVGGKIYANSTLVFKTISPPSALDFDPSRPILAVGTKLGEIVVVNGSNLMVYAQAFAPIESIWLLNGSRYVVVLAGSRVLVYQLYKSGWYEISPYKSTMVFKHLPLKVEQMVAAKRVSGEPGDRIAIIATPTLFKQTLLEVSGLEGTSASIEVVVPEYGYSRVYSVADDGLVSVEIPVPVKRFYVLVRIEGKCGVKIVDLGSYKYEIESLIHVKISELAYGECPEFKGTGVLLLDANLSSISSLWVPVEGARLLGLFEDGDRLILVASKDKKLVIVTKKSKNIKTYTYLLPARPTHVNMFDSNYIFIGCANGEVFVINATSMKLLWSGLFSSNSIAWLSAARVGEKYVIAVVDDKGKLAIGVLTDTGIVLTGYAELEGLPKPFKRVELWNDSILLPSKQGYIVVMGVEKFTRVWGDVARRAVKNIEVVCIGKRNETVKARVSVYYGGKLVSETIAPGKLALLVGENHTLQVVPLEKHYIGFTKTLYINVNTTRLTLLVPYKYYNIVVEAYDEYGVQGWIDVYVNGSLVTSLEGNGQNSVEAVLKLEYGCYNITLSGSPIYRVQSKIVCVRSSLKLPFKLARMPATLTISFGEKPVEKLAVKVYYGDRLVAEKVCVKETCDLDVVRGYNATIVVESLEKTPYYEPAKFNVNVLRSHLALLASLKSKKYEVEIVLQDPLGRLLCPVEVYLDGKRVGVVKPDNPVVRVYVTKGVHRLTMIGSYGNLKVYSEEREIVVKGPQTYIVNVTRMYTPVNVTIVDSFTGGGPLEDIVISSGNYSVVVNKSANPVNVRVYVYVKNPIIVVQGSKVYSERKVSVNFTEEKLVVKLMRRVVSAQISVVDDRGNPLDAKVVVKGVDTPYTTTLKTATGIAVFSAPVGVYEVCVQAPFYEETCRELDLAKTLRLEIVLKPTLVELLLRNISIFIVLTIFGVVGAILYRKRKKILESLLGGEGEEELF